MRHHSHALTALLGALTLICTIACSQGKEPAQTTEAAPQTDTAAPAQTPPQEQAAAAAASSLKSSPAAIQHAQRLGFPPVPEQSKVIGPFEGPEGSIFYADATGKVSYFVPSQKSAFFGQVGEDGSPKFQYAVRPEANYQIGADGAQTKLPAPPQEIMQWPYSGPMVNVMVEVLKKHLQELKQQQAQQNADVQTRAFVSRKMHEINMGILRNMGNDGCTKHYEGVYYLGCW